MPQLNPRQHLIALVVARIGWKELASRLDVPVAILHDWFNGETPMPDTKLVALLHLIAVGGELSAKGPMGATDKQRILKGACDLFGSKLVADELRVSEALLDGWIRGDVTMPDGELARLSETLVKLATTKK